MWSIVTDLARHDLLSTFPARSETVVTHLSYDSRDVSDGTLFICKGAGFVPAYLQAAAGKGAVAYLSEQPVPGAPEYLTPVLVKDIRRAMAVVACRFYCDPSSCMKLIGFTGTKGKTTSAYMSRSIMAETGVSWGLMGSIETDTIRRVIPSRLTTPEAPDFQKCLREMVDAGAPGASVEVSSQGLQYHRVDGTFFACGVFLNLSEDHISPREHRDFDEYLAAKARLFTMCKTGIVNNDDTNTPRILARSACEKLLTFGIDRQADVMAREIVYTPSGTDFTLVTPWFEGRAELHMPGRFNLMNALAAVAACGHLGAPFEAVHSGLASVQVRGRAEVLNGGGITVVVDFAHNKLSFETLVSAMRENYPGRRIVVVFGSVGGKAFARRRDLGLAAAALCDYSYVTSDHPGPENPLEICKEIARYIEQGRGAYEICVDRKTAIEKAIGTAREGDVLLLLGKGQEQYQTVDGRDIPYEGDLAIARACLMMRGG